MTTHVVTESDERRLRSPRLRNRQTRGDWYRMVQDKANDATEVWIYDEIGPWFAVTAKDFVKDLQAITSSTISLRLHSPGGEIFDSIAIYRALLEHPARVDVSIDALAASSASLIAMAGDRVTMSRHARMMIHDPFGIVMGDARDMRAIADQLDGLGDEIASIYAERAGGAVSAWRDRMRAETWYTDQEAVDAGLADEVGPAVTRATNHFDLSVFAHVPEDLTVPGYRPEAAAPRAEPHGTPTWTERDIEHALRDADVPRDLAKAILARGWAEREAPPAPPPDPPPPTGWYRARFEADFVELAVR